MSELVPPPVLPPSAPGRWGRRADAASVGLVLVFAFLAASFVARNSDLWLHLATGRLIAGGEYRFGTDPFAYTTTGTYWANHAWLFDLALYLGFNSVGGAGLVVAKAIAVAVTAALMLGTARGRGPVWIGAACVLVAALAMSPRLLLQPAVVSLPLLAGCLYCLRSGSFAVVPVLIALWVNLDAWFVLGPALVVLFWLGRFLGSGRSARSPWPVWLVPASFGACLLSPHHVYALRLPMELAPAVWASEFPSDPRFAGVFARPWALAPLGGAGGYSLSAWAFFVLLALGLVSFAVNHRAARGWRGLVWVPFAALAAWQVRLVPFFAVVGGPIAALNLRDVWPQTAYVRPGRAFVLALSTILIGLGWLGWINGINNRDRGAAWAVHTDPTLERSAVGLAAWRQATSTPSDAHVFTVHPDIGHYLAWFAPGERSFLDSRLQLFTGVAADYAALSQALGVVPGDAPVEDALRRNTIVAAALYDPDGGRLTRGVRAAVAGGWGVARVDGASVLLVPKTSRGAAPGFDAERAAFGGPCDLPVAGAGPSVLAVPAEWWHLKRGRGRNGSWEADSATIFLRMAESETSRSPALALLAVRAGRAGVELDPSDFTAWSALGRAYLVLGERTWEQEDGAGLSPFEHVRLAQATGAFVQAVLLNPDSAPAHESLARLYVRRNMLDLAHRHAAAAARLVRRGGPLPGESDEAFDERAAEAKKRAETLTNAVMDAENRFLIRTIGQSADPLGRARVAVDLGLTQKAVEVLRLSHSDLYGAAGLSLLIDLLIQTGQVADARDLLDHAQVRRNPASLGFYTLPRAANPNGPRGTYQLFTYDWLDFCQHAVAGNYPAALAALDRMSERLDEEDRRTHPGLVKGTAWALAGEVGFWAPPTPAPTWLRSAVVRAAFIEQHVRHRELSVARADLATVAGALELERGDPGAAAVRLQGAERLFAAAPAALVSRPGELLAARYLKALRDRR